MTDSHSTLDDEADDEPLADSRETCWFWESRTGRCHFEPLIPGSEPCADCPDEWTPEPRDSLSPGWPYRRQAWVMQRMRRNGWSIEGLARVFGLTPAGVESYLRKETRA